MSLVLAACGVLFYADDRLYARHRIMSPDFAGFCAFLGPIDSRHVRGFPSGLPSPGRVQEIRLHHSSWADLADLVGFADFSTAAVVRASSADVTMIGKKSYKKERKKNPHLNIIFLAGTRFTYPGGMEG